MRDKKTKGFTLVEIIVVLVIIAILAATVLPALTGYIKDAEDKVAMSDTRSFLVAAQAISSELYGLGCAVESIERYIFDGNKGTGAGAVPASFTKTVASVTGNAYFNDHDKVKRFSLDAKTGTVMMLELYTKNKRSVEYFSGLGMSMGTYHDK